MVLRVRWQIELLVKLWKSHGRIDESRSAQPWRILYEVYAKLLSMLVLHWIVLVRCWQYADRSLPKAAQMVQGHALTLGAAVLTAARLETHLHHLAQCLAIGCRINPRKQHPNTYQLLFALSDGGLT